MSNATLLEITCHGSFVYLSVYFLLLESSEEDSDEDSDDDSDDDSSSSEETSPEKSDNEDEHKVNKRVSFMYACPASLF